MNRVFISLVVGALLIGGLFLYQASRAGTSLVLLPSEVITESQKQPGSPDYKSLARIRVGGRVTTDRVEYQVRPNLRLSFSVRDPADHSGPHLPVVYHGLKPDMFAPGRDVIVDGAFRDGTLHASNLLTQCPSKYEPPTPSDPHKELKDPVRDMSNHANSTDS